MKVRSKIINRTISFIYLGFFVLGIACVALGTVQVINLYKENQRLLEIKENLENGANKQDIFEEFHFDEYYSVFVETDLNQAATTSGRKLGSVDGIASYIAEMLSLETGPYFYIEYAGVHSINGTDFYEFRCYRA